MKRKRTVTRRHVYDKYPVSSQRRRGSVAHSSDSNRSNYSRGLVTNAAWAGTLAATGGNGALAGLAYDTSQLAYDALFSTQSMSGNGGTTGHVPFARSTEVAGKRVRNKKAVKYSRKKAVRVSKNFRKKVAKVLVSKMVTGHVKHIYTGAIGAFEGQPNETASQDMGGLSSLQGSPGASNSQYIWQTLYNANTDGTNYYAAGIDFRLFSPARILDCASILWNDKIPAIDYATTAGNFTNSVNSDGVPDISNFRAAGGPQITVKYASATFVIKNNSQRTHFLKMYVCKAKRKFVSLSPLNAWKAAITPEAIETVHESFKNHNNQTILFGPTISDNSRVNPSDAVSIIGSGPNMFEGYKSNYTHEVVEFCIEPGQIVTQVVHGPKQQVYDWSKMIDGDQFQYETVYPAFDRWVMFVGNLDLVNDTSGRVGHHFGTIGVTNDKRLLCVEMTLNTVLAMPETAGFLGYPDLDTANNPQPLNMRRPRKALLNFTNYQAATYANVQRVDDENPVTMTDG